MNKGERNRITRLKHKKRAKNYGVKPEEAYWCKEQGKPCSCSVCKKERHKRKQKHKPAYELLDDDLIDD